MSLGIHVLMDMCQKHRRVQLSKMKVTFLKVYGSHGGGEGCIQHFGWEA
jgi:hypothetical protein